jgi:hypothetical protein
MFAIYQGPMSFRLATRHHRPRRAAAPMLAALGLGLGLALSGCADISDSMTVAFADPAKFDLYDCKQLEAERKSLAIRTAELQGLMAKAETAAGGSVVVALAYRNDYVAARGQSQFAEQAWRRNKCRESPPEEPAKSATAPGSAAAAAKPRARPSPPSQAGSAVY